MRRSFALPNILPFVLLLLITFYGQPGKAVEVAGTNLPDSLKVGKTDCKLSAVGVRNKLFIKVYAAGFYLEGPGGLETLISDDRQKAVLMHFIYRKVAVDKLNEAWREGFTGNTPEAGPDLKKRMADFIALFKEDAVSGDRILLSYIPEQGTTVIFNDHQLGTISGHDFNQALMKIWFGEKPADRGLKRSVADALSR